jgi:hypothetical protein
LLLDSPGGVGPRNGVAPGEAVSSKFGIAAIQDQIAAIPDQIAAIKGQIAAIKGQIASSPEKLPGFCNDGLVQAAFLMSFLVQTRLFGYNI